VAGKLSCDRYYMTSQLTSAFSRVLAAFWQLSAGLLAAFWRRAGGFLAAFRRFTGGFLAAFLEEKPSGD